MILSQVEQLKVVMDPNLNLSTRSVWCSV